MTFYWIHHNWAHKTWRFNINVIKIVIAILTICFDIFHFQFKFLLLLCGSLVSTHEKETKSLKPNFNILLSPILLPILPWYMHMWLNKKSDWKKFEFGVKSIFPQYAYVIGKKIVVLKKSGNRESNLLEKRANTTTPLLHLCCRVVL